MAHFNYANALYFGLPDIDVNRLQRVQNIAARLILGKTNQDSITECLRELHWLPIRAQIDLKSWCWYTSACGEMHQNTSKT